MSINRQWAGVGIVLTLIAALVGAGWLLRDRFMPIGVGSAAPRFEATTLAGDPIDLTHLRGKVVLLNVWATWCEPCREEMPAMQALYEDYASKGLEIVAVSIDAPTGLRDRGGRLGGNVAAFAEDMGLTFPIWLDPSGKIYQTYRMTGVPESFVIDQFGDIVTKRIGAWDWNSPERRAFFDRLLED